METGTAIVISYDRTLQYPMNASLIYYLRIRRTNSFTLETVVSICVHKCL